MKRKISVLFTAILFLCGYSRAGSNCESVHCSITYSSAYTAHAASFAGSISHFSVKVNTKVPAGFSITGYKWDIKTPNEYSVWHTSTSTSDSWDVNIANAKSASGVLTVYSVSPAGDTCTKTVALLLHISEEKK